MKVYLSKKNVAFQQVGDITLKCSSMLWFLHLLLSAQLQIITLSFLTYTTAPILLYFRHIYKYVFKTFDKISLVLYDEK